MWQRRIFLCCVSFSLGPEARFVGHASFSSSAGPGGRPSGPHRVLYPYQKSFFYLCHATPPYTPSTISFYFIIRPDLRRVRLLPSPLSRERAFASHSFLQLVLMPPLSFSLSRSSFVVSSSSPPLLHFYTSLFEKRFASRLTKKLESRIDTKRFFSLSLFLRVFI